ncbi:MAG: hypothetical protein NTY19_24710 [Planctomycetota bacterium]|nr:hypothetical protein [Planctomycetota bacterium]
MTRQNGVTSFDALVTPELESRIKEAALSEEGFLERLLTDPKGTYRDRFGEELLPGEEIEVLHREDGGTTLYLPRLDSGMIIHEARAEDDDELTDAELEMVAGGGVTICDARKGPC